MVSQPEPPKKYETCSECQQVGQVGPQVVPYSFGPNDYRWLCWAGTGRDCMVKAWRKFKAA